MRQKPKQKECVMSELDLNAVEQKQILESEIKMTNANIYRFTIRYTVNERVKDTKAMEECKKVLEEQETRLHALQAMLKELK